MAERGITVDHVTIYRWVQRFNPEFADAARPGRHALGNRWFVDETYVKVGGQWVYLCRAVDQHGQVIDVLLSARRDLAAARRFFTRPLRAGTIPVEITTDRAPVYPRVLDELVPSALHTVEQYANNLRGSITRSGLGRLAGLESSLSDLLGGLPAHVSSARLPDGVPPEDSIGGLTCRYWLRA